MLIKCGALVALLVCFIQVQNSESYSAPCPEGEKGDLGYPGIPGMPGVDGLKGDKGDAAPFDEFRIREIIQEVLKGESEARPIPPPSFGRKGERGDNGYYGIKGMPGRKGVRGDNGELDEDQVREFVRGVLNESKEPITQNEYRSSPISNGVRGEKGDKGEYGIIGMPGMPGEKGDVGEPGYRGYDGLPGLKGEQGYTGLPGLVGAPGRPGVPGMDGEPGPYGPPGVKGDSGDSAIVDDSHIREVIHDVLSEEGLLKPPTLGKPAGIFA